MAQALRRLNSVELTDDEKYDRVLAMHGVSEPTIPDYPEGLCFSLAKDDLAKISEGAAEPGATLHFAAMGTAIGVFRDRENCRIEVELTELAGADGQFAPIDRPAAICLRGEDCEKIDLDDDCERGDTIHLIGSARVESTESSRWGDDTVRLQIVELAVEDESAESR